MTTFYHVKEKENVWEWEEDKVLMTKKELDEALKDGELIDQEIMELTVTKTYRVEAQPSRLVPLSQEKRKYTKRNKVRKNGDRKNKVGRPKGSKNK